jgi:flagellar basal-body rod protein FlgC
MINVLSGIQGTLAALDAQRARINVISQNIANAQTTKGPDGKPYQRQSVVFESALQQATGGGDQQPTLRVARIEKDLRPGQLVYNPGHPDADARGMVAMPNVNLHEEMADLMAASRSFEANLAVVRSARTMALQTLALGKR